MTCPKYTDTSYGGPVTEAGDGHQWARLQKPISDKVAQQVPGGVSRLTIHSYGHHISYTED